MKQREKHLNPGVPRAFPVYCVFARAIPAIPHRNSQNPRKFRNSHSDSRAIRAIPPLPLAVEMPRGRARLAGAPHARPARCPSRRVACIRRQGALAAPCRREARAQQRHAGAPRRTTTDRHKTRGDRRGNEAASAIATAIEPGVAASHPRDAARCGEWVRRVRVSGMRGRASSRLRDCAVALSSVCGGNSRPGSMAKIQPARAAQDATRVDGYLHPGDESERRAPVTKVISRRLVMFMS